MNIFNDLYHSLPADYFSNLNIGFIQKEFYKGDAIELKYTRNNYILFLLRGSLILSCKEFGNRQFAAEEMIFIPRASHCFGYATDDTHLIVLTYDTPIYIYDKMWLESLVTACKHIGYNFEGLAIKEPMKLFLRSMQTYLKDNIDSSHLYEIKQKEFFLILQSYYTKEEQISFLYPSIGRSIDFRGSVMANYLIAKNATDLARICGYSTRTFSRKFNEEFGETPYAWMQKQLSLFIKSRLLEKYTSFKSISEEFRFSSIEHFIRFCKANLGDTPAEFRRKNKIV